MKHSLPQRLRWFGATVLSVMALSVAALAHAHGNHEAPAAPQGATSPRFAAVSDLFEVVGIKSDKEIRIFVDRFATNEPVLNAKVSVEVSGKTIATAFQADDGTHLLPKEPFAKPGTYALVINVEAGEEIDILAANFVMPEEAVHGAHSHTKEWIALVAASLGTLFVVWILVRFVRSRRANNSSEVGHA